MKPASTLAGVLLVALQAGCASGYRGDPSSAEFPPPPADVMAIHTYWTGEKAPCPVVRVMEVSAASENGLRWAAWNARSQAVVSVRARLLDSMPTQPHGAARVYEGVAVRWAEGCTPAAADSASRSAR